MQCLSWPCKAVSLCRVAAGWPLRVSAAREVGFAVNTPRAQGKGSRTNPCFVFLRNARLFRTTRVILGTVSERTVCLQGAATGTHAFWQVPGSARGRFGARCGEGDGGLPPPQFAWQGGNQHSPACSAASATRAWRPGAASCPPRPVRGVSLTWVLGQISDVTFPVLDWVSFLPAVRGGALRDPAFVPAADPGNASAAQATDLTTPACGASRHTPVERPRGGGSHIWGRDGCVACQRAACRACAWGPVRRGVTVYLVLHHPSCTQVVGGIPALTVGFLTTVAGYSLVVWC